LNGSVAGLTPSMKGRVGVFDKDLAAHAGNAIRGVGQRSVSHADEKKN
jgi:hypothetical protein